MPSDSEDIVVDTNILFSALLSARSDFSEILLKSPHRFFICEQVLVELFRRKEKLLKLSRLSETDLAHFYHVIIRRVTLFKEDLISTDNLVRAWELCRDIDEEDTPHVALTLEVEGLLWTGDKRLKEGLQMKGFYHFFT
ncbi:MAG: PIN domain-containing protein [Blastocatellales bacterium]